MSAHFQAADRRKLEARSAEFLDIDEVDQATGFWEQHAIAREEAEAYRQGYMDDLHDRKFGIGE